MPRLQEKEISTKRHAERSGCQERIGNRHAERRRDLKKKFMPRESETSRKRCQDFKRKRF